MTKTEALIQDVEDHHTRKPARTARSAILSLVTALLVLPLMMVTAAVVAFAGQSKAMDEAFYEEQRQLARDSAGLNDREAAEQVRQARLARESASARRKLLVLVFNVGVPLLLELTAIVSGILALSWIARSAGALAGRMLAISGLVIAGANLCAVLAVVALVLRTS